MQQMRRAVVAHGIFAALSNNIGLHAVAHAQMAFVDIAIVYNEIANGAARILYFEGAHRPGQITTIADLAATFGVERGGIEQHQRGLWCADALDLLAVDYQRGDFTAACNAIVACEVGRTTALEDSRERFVVLRLHKDAGRTAAFLLALHRLLEAGGIHGKALLGGDLLCQLDREAVRIVELEDLLAGNDRLTALLQIMQ